MTVNAWQNTKITNTLSENCYKSHSQTMSVCGIDVSIPYITHSNIGNYTLHILIIPTHSQ